MGRLDEAAKRKVVELRAAGLSFRKIKAVLELENIKVSAQAIYLFLKEFNVRNGTNQKVGGNLAGLQANVQGMAPSTLGNLGRTNSWRDRQLGNLMREASRVAGYSTSPDPHQQGGPSSDDRRTLPSAAAAPTGGGSRDEQKQDGNDEEEDIRIVSVTSLAQRAGVQPQRTNLNTGVGAMTGIYARRRLTASPATTNPVLLARKRLLDKALLHRARLREGAPTPGQQVAPAQRREQSWRSMVLPQASSSIDLTATRPQQVRRPVDAGPDARRAFQPRMAAPPPPRVGVRLPSPSAPLPPSPTTQQAPAANPTIRIQHPAANHQQPPQRREPSPSFQLGALEALRQGLGDQLQSLGSEVRSLGLAVRMLAEQQGRLEREQSQQTQVQKQILSTLQLLATRLGPCSNTHTHTPAPAAQPTLPAVSTFTQGTFPISTQSSFSQGTISLTDNSGLDSTEGFSMSGMCSAGMNGFGSSEGLQAQAHVAHAHVSPPYSSQAFTSHAPSEYTPSLVQSHAQMQSPILGQGPSLAHTQAHADAFAEGKNTDFSTGQVDGSLRNCSTSMSPISLSTQDDQLNIIKVENV